MTNPNLTDVQTVRTILSVLIMKLQEELEGACFEPEADDVQERKRIWGDKESVMSSLVKLSGLLIKLIPLEEALEAGDAEAKTLKKILSSDDYRVIQAYLEQESVVHSP